MNKIHIKNARVVDAATKTDSVRNLFIADGQIVGLDSMPNEFTADTIIDATGLIAVPGLIDLRAHLREPGFEYKATIESEAKAAAASGITTLVCSANTQPIVDDIAVVHYIQSQAHSAGAARVQVVGALTTGLEGHALSDMRALADAGCVGVSNFYAPIENTLALRRALEYAASHDLTVHYFPEDPWLANGSCAHEGYTATRLGLPSVPAISERIALIRVLTLAAKTGTKLHIGNVSTASSVGAIQKAQARGQSVTADVAMHQLFFNDTQLVSFDTNLHVKPPFRSENDRLTLIDGLKSGVIRAICTDHQPHDADAKLLPFGESAAGISGLDTFLPLLLNLADNYDVDLIDALSWVTTNPASIIRSENRGSLSVGSAADVCLIDPQVSWYANATNILSQGKNTPWFGATMLGRAVYTLVDGSEVFSSISN